MAAQMILGLSILVLLHEFGHYIAARAFGIRVEKFYMFFDAWKVKLFSIKKGETEYGIGWLPLGGYVKIAGMVDESMDKEQLKKPPQPWEFRSKPAWQRLIVMVSGVVMNLILGIILFAVINMHYVESYLSLDEVNTKGGIYAYDLGRDVGFKTGDKIVSLNGEKPERFSDLLSTRVIMGAEVVINRNGREIALNIPDTLYKEFKKGRKPFIDALIKDVMVDSVPDSTNAYNAGIRKGDKIIAINGEKINSFNAFKENLFSNRGDSVKLKVERSPNTFETIALIDSSGLLGYFVAKPDYNFKDYTFISGLKYGFKDAIELLYANIKGIGKIFSGEEKASESVRGPIGIAEMFGGEWLWERFWRLVGLLSLILAFMNILPIPALDGGHVIILTIEMITGKPLPEKVMERIQMVGMVILLSLMVLIIGNDIFRIFT